MAKPLRELESAKAELARRCDNPTVAALARNCPASPRHANRGVQDAQPLTSRSRFPLSASMWGGMAGADREGTRLPPTSGLQVDGAKGSGHRVTDCFLDSIDSGGPMEDSQRFRQSPIAPGSNMRGQALEGCLSAAFTGRKHARLNASGADLDVERSRSDFAIMVRELSEPLGPSA